MKGIVFIADKASIVAVMGSRNLEMLKTRRKQALRIVIGDGTHRK